MKNHSKCVIRKTVRAVFRVILVWESQEYVWNSIRLWLAKCVFSGRG